MKTQASDIPKVKARPKKERHRKRLRLTSTTTLHYCKLVYRSLLFVGALVLYISHLVRSPGEPFTFDFARMSPVWVVALAVIGVVYVVEMVLRFFPARLESMGCQKQFACNYKGEPGTKLKPSFPKSVALVAVIWLAFNAVFAALYFLGIIDQGVLLLISLAYGICDIVCILFFCPFQMWFMKNRCCGTCRIYNWDFPMMFTPYIIIPHPYTWTLLALALALLIRWEVTAYRHPERFLEETNPAMSCQNCTEKLCAHKKHIRKFIGTDKKS